MSHEPLPDWVLLRFRLGELPEPRMAQVRAQVAADPALRARVQAMDEDEAALLRRRPPRSLAAAVAERAAVRRRRSRIGLAVPALAAAVLLGVVVLPAGTPEAPTAGVRAKGALPYLRVFRQVPGGVEELQPGDQARAGDVLQLHYAALGRSWGLVFSVDGDGVVTRHLPVSGESAAPLESAGTVALPSSYRLDRAPDFERFYFVSARHPFHVGPVLEAARGGSDRLDLQGDLDVDAFTLLKTPGAP